MYGGDCGGTWLESPINISSTLVGVSSPSASHLQKRFNSTNHNYLESDEKYADCQNLFYQLEQRRMAGPPFLALTKSHVLANKI